MLSGRPGRLRRREFLLRYAGNAMLAAGASLFGAAAAYEIYVNRAEAGLGNLKRGTFTLPGGPQPPAAGAQTQSTGQSQASAIETGPQSAAAATSNSGAPPATVDSTSVPTGAEPALAAAAPAA